MEPNQPQGQQIRIEIDDSVADGTYANLSFISANSAEFIVDFARFLPGNTRGKVISRIVLTPAHALALFKSLKSAVENHEKQFGPIKGETSNKNIGFNIGEPGDKKE
jgi:hypothetical protein